MRWMVLLGLLSSCGATDRPADPVDAGAVADAGTDANALAEAASEYSRGLCERYFACCTPNELIILFGGDPPRDVEDCVPSFVDRLAVDALAPYIASGLIRFDSVAFSACLQELSVVPCDAFTPNRPPAVCRGIWVGTIPDGQPCPDLIGCMSPSACNDGICGPPRQLGESCANAVCAEGLYCSGARCELQFPDGTTCNDDLQCREGCLTEPGSPPVCGPYPAVCPG